MLPFFNNVAYDNQITKHGIYAYYFIFMIQLYFAQLTLLNITAHRLIKLELSDL